MSNPIKLLIVDDHPVFRFGLRTLLENQVDMIVIGEAENGHEAVELSNALEPDVILMDVDMAGQNGIDATTEILKDQPDANVLIVTMLDDETVFAAMQAGAKGYLLKGAQGVETLRAIRAVANGEVIFSPGVARQMMDFFTRRIPLVPTIAFPELTPREREVLTLISQGLTNSAIAERLFLSPKTIRNQVSAIFSKLHVATRSEAIIKAREAGLGDSKTSSS